MQPQPLTPRGSMRRAAMASRRPTPCIRRNRTGRWRSSGRRISLTPWSARSPIHLAVLPPTKERKSCPSRGRCPAFTRRRNHRPFLSHRTECGFGAACAGFWTNGGTRSCQFPADPVTSEAILGGTTTMASENNGAFIRNIAEVPWREFPNHFGGALSKPLVMPETAGARHLDYRISMYQPMAHVARHKHQVQEQIYHVLEGEGLMEIAGKNHVVRKHDFIFLPPGVEHAISNSGLVDLVFLVITSPVTDDGKIV